MKRYRISDMPNGWLVGDFEPSVLRTKAFEVSVRRHTDTDDTKNHYHKLSTEINVIVDGKMTVNGEELSSGDIFVIEPREVSVSKFLRDTTLVIIKVPSVVGDKYFAE